MMRDGKEEAREKEGGDGSPTSIVRLTGRDEELMWHVATARYRRLQQLKKIVFVRSLNGKEGEEERAAKRWRTRQTVRSGCQPESCRCPRLQRLHPGDKRARTLLVR